MAYLYDLTDTWNAAGTVFNAIKMNVTNTASAAGSKIVSLQVGATDRFTVDKDGNGYFSGTLQAVGSISSPNLYIGANSGTIGMQDNTASILAYNGTGSGGITNTLRFITGAAERVRIDGSGNVGIGTSSPGAKLDVNGSVRFVDSSAAGPDLLFGNVGGGTSINNVANARTYIGAYETVFTNYDNSTERMRIDSSGNVGMGIDSPQTALEVYRGAGTAAYLSLIGNNGVASQLYVGQDAAGLSRIFQNGANPITVWTNGSERMRIDASGRLLVGQSSSFTAGGSAQWGRFQMTGNVFNGFGDAVLALGRGVAATGITAGEKLGVISFSDNAGNTFAEIAAFADAAAGVNDYPGRIVFSTTADGQSSPTERMRLDASGNLGIGTSSPGSKLEVTGNIHASSGGDTRKVLVGLLGAGIEYNVDGSTILQGRSDSYPLLFKTNNAERMRIAAAGDVGIGTSSPSQPLHISVPAAGIFVNSSGQGTASLWMAGTSGSASLTQFGGELRFNTGGSANTAASGATERMRLDSSGNVGIGAAPLSFTPLYLYRSGADAGLRAERASGAALDMFATASTAYFGTATNHPLLFQTNGSEKARIDSSGNLLVGKTASAATSVGFQVDGAGALYTTKSTSTSADATYYLYSTGASAYRFYVDMAGTIFATSTTISEISDIRLKKNVRELDAGLDVILALKPRRFDWKEGKGKDVKDDMGFIAQEVEEVLPALIGGWKAGEGEPDDLKSVKAGDLIPVLVKAIQELTARVAQLEGN